MSYESFSRMVREHQKVLANSHVFMVDVVRAARAILESYRALSADIIGATISCESEPNRDQLEITNRWHFDLPTRKGNREGEAKWVCEAPSQVEAIYDLVRSFCIEHIPLINLERDEGARGSEIVSFGHRIALSRVDGKDSLIHILFARMLGSATAALQYVFLVVREDASSLPATSVRKHIGPLTIMKRFAENVSGYENVDAAVYSFNTIEVFARLIDKRLKSISDDSVRFWFLAVGLDRSIATNSFISPSLIQRSWDEALKTDSRNTGLPWEYRGRDISGIVAGPSSRPGARVPTFTLSLDLRKSTSLMDQVEQPGAFAIWLESLSEICRSIVHDNGGIFDKFTGDGVIAHFAAAAEEPTDGEKSIYDQALTSPEVRKQAEQAFTCGCELIRAVQEHLKRLRPLLRFDIGKAGPSVGIAFDDASWSLDRDGRPIVVGKGVVNACRLTGAPEGVIEMANNFRRFFGHMATKASFIPSIEIRDVENHKDLKSDISPRDIMCRIDADNAADPFPGRRRGELELEVERIFVDVEAMHRNRAFLLMDEPG